MATNFGRQKSNTLTENQFVDVCQLQIWANRMLVHNIELAQIQAVRKREAEKADNGRKELAVESSRIKKLALLKGPLSKALTP